MYRYIEIGIVGIFIAAVIILILYLVFKNGARKVYGDRMKRERMVNEGDKEVHDTNIPYEIDRENMTLHVNDISKKDFDETFSKYKGKLIKFLDGFQDGDIYRYIIPTVRIENIRYVSGQTVIKFKFAGPIEIINIGASGLCQSKLCYGAIFHVPEKKL